MRRLASIGPRTSPPRAAPRSPSSRRCAAGAGGAGSSAAMASGSSSESGWSGGSMPARRADAAVDDDMRDMDALRRQLARHRLRQPAQRELAHGERRRLRIALHAGRGAGQEHRAVPMRQHAPHRRLRDQESAEGGDGNRLLDLGRIEIDQRPARAIAGIVDDDVRRGLGGVERGKHGLDVGALRGVACEGARAGVLRQAAQACRARARRARPPCPLWRRRAPARPRGRGRRRR